MVSTLNEMANKLQAFIVDLQMDARSGRSVNFNMAKYNNLKLAMDETIRYPHIIIRIGMSEAIYNVKSVIRTEGGLGPDEKFVQKWLGSNTIISELKDIYLNFRENLTGDGHHSESDDYAIDVDSNGKFKRVYEVRAAVGYNKRVVTEDRKKQIKSELKDFLKSSRRRLT
ncbi:hypothetical protein J6I39_01300 [bacterium]|nr:hypothetical protein [bacterium]